MPAPPMPTRCSGLPVHVIERRTYRASAGVPGQSRAGGRGAGSRGLTLPCAPVAATTTAPRVRVPQALRAALVPAFASRVVVWAAGVPAVLALGYSGWRARADPTDITGTLGSVGHVVGAPVMRWDSVYYVQVANDGYTQAKQAGFFPLYPYVIGVFGAPIITGVLLSLAAF